MSGRESDRLRNGNDSDSTFGVDQMKYMLRNTKATKQGSDSEVERKITERETLYNKLEDYNRSKQRRGLGQRSMPL